MKKNNIAKMKKSVTNLSQKLREAEIQHFESETFDTEEFEGEEDIQDLEYLAISNPRARKDKIRAIQTPRIAIRQPQAGSKIVGRATQAKGVSFNVPNSASIVAQFDLQFTRQMVGSGSGIDNIPVPVFGFASYKSDYITNIASPAPSHITAKGGDIEFIYDPLGTLTDYDIITVHCVTSNAPYRTILEMLSSKNFRTSRFRFNAGTTANIEVFNQSLGFVDTGLFGKQGSDSLSLSSYGAAGDYNLFIRDIPYAGDFTPWKVLNFPCPITTGYTVNKTYSYICSIFVEIFEK